MEYIIQIMGEFQEDYSYRWFDMKRHRRIYVPAMYYTSSSDVAIIRNNLTKYLKSNNPYIRIAFGLAIEAEYASKMPEKRYKKVVAFMKIPASVYKESYIHFQKAIGDDTPEALFYAGRALLFSAESDEDRKKAWEYLETAADVFHMTEASEVLAYAYQHKQFGNRNLWKAHKRRYEYRRYIHYRCILLDALFHLIY